VGFDRQYQRGSGQYLYDAEGEQYLDLLSGWGVFALGRNHPAMREALKGVLDAELPNLVQLDLSALAGVLAERRATFRMWRANRSRIRREGRRFSLLGRLSPFRHLAHLT